jgi:tetratricopeptide (TPR) repeat protein
MGSTDIEHETDLRKEIELLRHERRFDQAIKLISEGLAKFPDSVLLYNEYGWLHFEREDYDQALREFERSLQLAPSDEGALQGKIASLRKKGLYQDAEKLFEQTLHKNRSQRLGLLTERGWLYFDQGQLNQAAREFSGLSERNPNSVELGLSYAEVLMWTDRSTEALGVLGTLRKQFPQDLEVREKLGLFFLRRNDLARAETEFNAILREEAGNRLGINGLGLVYFSQDRYDEAVTCFNSVLQREPDNPVILTNLARTLVRMDDSAMLDAAEQYCNRALELEPRSAQAYGCLGVIAFKRGNLTQSEYLLHASTQVNSREGSYTDLGALYVRMAKDKEAKVTLNKAIEINPYDVQAHFELGNLYLHTGAIKEAMREFRQAMATEPSNEETRRALAITLISANEFNEAEEVLRAGLRLIDKSKRWRLHLTLAQLLLQMGDENSDSSLYNEALAEIKEAVALQPQNPEPYFYRGITQAKLANYRGARKSFKLCQDRDKDFYQAERFDRLVQQQVREERKRSAGSVYAGVMIAVIAVAQLFVLWFVYLTTDKITQDFMTVVVPLLFALVAAGLLVPWLIRFKIPGLEAELRQPREDVSSEPKGQIGLTSSPTSSGPARR